VSGIGEVEAEAERVRSQPGQPIDTLSQEKKGGKKKRKKNWVGREET
jgi:hypothetical protein